MDSDKKQQLDTLITHVTGATTSSSVTNAQVAKMCQLLEELLSAEETRSIAAETALKVVASVTANGLMSSIDKQDLEQCLLATEEADVNPEEDDVVLSLYTKDSGNNLDITIPSATATAAGVMSKTDKLKLNGIDEGAEKNPAVATESTDGLMSASDKAKLNGLGTVTKVTLTPSSPSKAIVVKTGTYVRVSILGNTASNIGHMRIYYGSSAYYDSDDPTSSPVVCLFKSATTGFTIAATFTTSSIGNCDLLVETF